MWLLPWTVFGGEAALEANPEGIRGGSGWSLSQQVGRLAPRDPSLHPPLTPLLQPVEPPATRTPGKGEAALQLAQDWPQVPP